VQEICHGKLLVVHAFIPLLLSPVLIVQSGHDNRFARYESSLFARRLLSVCLERVLVSRVCCSLRSFSRRRLRMRLSGRVERERTVFLRREHQDPFLWRNLAVMRSCRESSGEHVSMCATRLVVDIIPL
jgi:hypothetical protein